MALIDAIVVAVVVAVVILWFWYRLQVDLYELRVRHRTDMARINFDCCLSLLSRAVTYRDECVEKGIELWKKGVVALSPHAYPTKWAHAVATCRHILGRDAPFLFNVDIAPSTTAAFETEDGMVHAIVRLRIDGHSMLVFACLPDVLVEAEEFEDCEREEAGLDDGPTTCLACLATEI